MLLKSIKMATRQINQGKKETNLYRYWNKLWKIKTFNGRLLLLLLTLINLLICLLRLYFGLYNGLDVNTKHLESEK